MTDSWPGSGYENMNWSQKTAMIIAKLIVCKLVQNDYLKAFLNPAPQVGGFVFTFIFCFDKH